jgi:hypothetical protein
MELALAGKELYLGLILMELARAGNLQNNAFNKTTGKPCGFLLFFKNYVIIYIENEKRKEDVYVVHFGAGNRH